MIDIPTLQRNIPITRDDFPSDQYHLWWQSVVKALTDSITAQQQQIADIQTALDTATKAKNETARTSSYTVPTNVLTASDGGSSATITVAGHNRVYPGVGQLTLTGGSLTGLLYSTAYFVYYDDTTLANTSPAYHATTVAKDAQVGAADGRHFVGTVTTPASGGGSVGGSGGSPPGGGGGPIP